MVEEMPKLMFSQNHLVSHNVSKPFATTWSEDNHLAFITEKGIQFFKTSAETLMSHLRHLSGSATSSRPAGCLAAVILLSILLSPSPCLASDITFNVFHSETDGMPAAFGDFDSDKFTDLFVLKNNESTVEILLGADTEPLLQQKNLKCDFDKTTQHITSVVPGDFDGDALMDVLVTVYDRSRANERSRSINDVYILWGSINSLNCSVIKGKPLISLKGQPLAVDWDQDMIIDLFGVDEDDNRAFWIFKKDRTKPEKRLMDVSPVRVNGTVPKLKAPHSHAFLDLNGDSYGDLYLTRDDGQFEVWLYDARKLDFRFDVMIMLPPGVSPANGHYIGQTVFQDMALEGRIDHLIPVCFSSTCNNSTLFLRSGDKWHNIKVDLHDWQFVHPAEANRGSRLYLETLTLRAGDFNMDGYPDLLATLTLHDRSQYRVFLLENVECSKPGCDFARTFEVKWTALHPFNNDTVLGVFYDFLQDGILDVILVHSKPYRVSAFRNSLDYDTNFVKVMVLTGLRNANVPTVEGPLGKKPRTYGTNLPGPTILYHTTTQEGNPRAAVSTQLPQSAHFSLMLPYTIFGLGRTPNFVDSLKVGVYGHSRAWTQLIPNSQVVVIPMPPNDPSQWKVQLFVTPSKLILQSVFALLGTCILIFMIIGVLYWKERREDHREKLQEAHKFHFDAM